MTVTEKNVIITKPWITKACRNEELAFAMLTIKENGMVQLYRTEEITKENLIRQLRHIADQMESGKIILLS